MLPSGPRAADTPSPCFRAEDRHITEQIKSILGTTEVDCGIDAVGFEARGCGHAAHTEQPAQVLNDLQEIVGAAGSIGIPGLYVTEDPGAADESAKMGSLSVRLGLGWSKSISYHTGQCPVMRYHKDLMNAILYDRIDIAKCVNVKMIGLDEAPAGYRDFDQGASVKYVIDPHRICSH